MKLKYNQDSVTETIPLSTRKKQGKRLAIHHNDQNYYAPVVSTDDSLASNLPIGVNGEIFAVQSQPPPEVTAVNVAPSSVAVMQGQSATATVSAIGNEYISGLSYGLSGAPTWITISDDVILIQPSDSDLGIAQVQVYAQDTGSDAMSAAILRAEAKLRPIIESLSVIPPAVTVMQGQSAVATISATANEAVTGLSYSISGASSWLTLTDNSIIAAPTDNDRGTNVLDVFAYDVNSSASASAQFSATAELRPIISSVAVNPPTVSAIQGESTTATISAIANEAVTSITYGIDGNPDWMNLSGSVILMTPTLNDLGSAAVTVTARDTGSTAQANTVFNAEAIKERELLDITIPDLPESIYGGYESSYHLNYAIANSSVWGYLDTTLESEASFISKTNDYIFINPNDTVSGIFTFTIIGKVRYSGETLSKQFSIQIVEPTTIPITISPTVQTIYAGINDTTDADIYFTIGSGALRNDLPRVKGYIPKNATLKTYQFGYSYERRYRLEIYYPMKKQTLSAGSSCFVTLQPVPYTGYKASSAVMRFDSLYYGNADYIDTILKN